MQIAVISDTHNQLERIQVVAYWLRKQKIGTIIHCGDLTDPELLAYLDGLQVLCIRKRGPCIRRDSGKTPKFWSRESGRHPFGLNSGWKEGFCDPRAPHPPH